MSLPHPSAENIYKRNQSKHLAGFSLFGPLLAINLRNYQADRNGFLNLFTIYYKKLEEGFYGELPALELMLEDARHAADLLRPVFDRTDGVDGWVVLGGFPLSTNDTVSLVTSVANFYAKV